MPSFDIVSEVDNHEASNAVDQANREIDNRFDFNGTGAKFVFEQEKIQLSAPSDFQIKQMQDVLESKWVKRGLDVQSFEWGDIEANVSEARQSVSIRQGIDKDNAKKIIKQIKASKIKVQAQIQGEQVRVTGKKRDDLQAVMSFLKDSDTELPLQFNNFRD